MYELIRATLRIRFRALESVLIDWPKIHKGKSVKDDGTIDDTMAFRIIDEICRKSEITLDHRNNDLLTDSREEADREHPEKPD